MMFWMISTLWLAWEDADLDKELGSATAGACRASFDSFQSGKEKCRPFAGGILSKLPLRRLG